METTAAPNLRAKRRDAAATRAAILRAAHLRFLRESYDSVGLRDIAGDAGVDVALISRYFGGKEGLFSEVLWPEGRQGFDPSEHDGDLVEYLTQLVTDDTEDDHNHRMEMFVMMLRSASSPKAGKIIRHRVNEDVLEPMTAALGDESGEWRANMLLAILMGVGVLRTVMESDGLACTGKDKDEYLRRYRQLFAGILNA
jgi:hypothetical protein